MSIGDWRLQYDAANGYPGADFSFGGTDPGFLFTKMPVLDSSDYRTDDTDAPRSDVTLFGQDFRGGRLITFEMEASYYADTLDESEALVTEALDELMAVWDGDAVAKTGGAVASLTSHTGRTAFGRPRKPVADTTRTWQGRSTVSAEFQTVDNLWYGPEQVEPVSLVPLYTGGVTSPVTSPVTTEAPSGRSKIITVGGRVPTRGVVTIRGPVINPVAELVDVFRFGFATTLAYDEWITIDTRAWRPRIMRNGTAGIATDARSTRLLDAVIPPGEHEFVLRGTAPTGLPQATVAWRDAHKHW